MRRYLVQEEREVFSGGNLVRSGAADQFMAAVFAEDQFGIAESNDGWFTRFGRFRNKNIHFHAIRITTGMGQPLSNPRAKKTKRPDFLLL
jgi:hypothetical protein